MKFYYPDRIDPIVTIELPGELFPVRREIKRWQNIGITEDGSVKVYDRGVEEIFYIISLGPLTDEEMNSLEDFIRNTVKFRLHSFDMENRGEVVRVRFWEEVLKKEEKFLNKFWVKFKLRKEI